MTVPQKIKNRVTVWPSNSSLDIYTKRIDRVSEDICTPTFIAALFTVKCEATQASVKKLLSQRKLISVIIFGRMFISQIGIKISPGSTCWWGLKQQEGVYVKIVCIHP